VSGLGGICLLEDNKKLGWGFLILSNLFLGAWSLMTGSWAYLIMQVVYTGISLKGLLRKQEHK